MIADLFRKDYRQMTAQGVEFTPDDIIRLNALAVRARLATNAAGTLALQRVAFLPKRRIGVLALFEGEIVLREPTIAHDIWIEQAMRFVQMDDRNMNFLYGYALSRDPEKLVDAFNPNKLIRTVFKFAAKRLSGYTDEQLSSAVDYCLFGADWTACERVKSEELRVKSDGGSTTLNSQLSTLNS